VSVWRKPVLTYAVSVVSLKASVNCCSLTFNYAVLTEPGI